MALLTDMSWPTPQPQMTWGVNLGNRAKSAGHPVNIAGHQAGTENKNGDRLQR